MVGLPPTPSPSVMENAWLPAVRVRFRRVPSVVRTRIPVLAKSASDSTEVSMESETFPTVASIPPVIVSASYAEERVPRSASATRVEVEVSSHCVPVK